jgi:type I restriction enzyme S subunit
MSRRGEREGSPIHPGDIVKASWQEKPLVEICAVFTDGDWVESKDQSEEGIRLIQTGNVGQGEFKDREAKARYISELTFNRLKCTEIFKGDCLISRLPDPVGRSCLLPINGQKMITAVDCTIARFKPGVVDSKFFVYYSQSEKYLRNVNTETTGTTRKRISRANLGRVRVPLPPLDEQHRIVGILDNAFAAIATAKANTEKSLLNARALFERELSFIFSQRSRTWTVQKFGALATFRNGVNYTQGSKGEQIQIVGVKDFQKNFWAPTDNLDTVRIDGRLDESDVLKNGDLLVVRSNGNIELIGRCLLVNGIPNRVSHSGFTIRARLSGTSVLPEYLCHFMKSAETRHRLTAGGTGTNIKSLNQQMLAALEIPFPPVDDQRELVRKIEALSSQTGRLANLQGAKLAALGDFRKSLLGQAFSGAL